MRRFFVFFMAIAFALGIRAQEYPVVLNQIEGFIISGEKQFYGKDNLYDYINGASDFYLGYQFQDLWVVDYANPDGNLVTLELYRHKNPMFAFGIYTEERPQGVEVGAIGAEGFVESGAVFFLANEYYVKVYNGYPAIADEDLLKFSKMVASLICENCALPQLFNTFPDEGRLTLSERYMPENFMGISGFNGVCTVGYEVDGAVFKVFAFKGSDDECRKIMQKYFTRLKYKKKLKEKMYYFNDPYLGKVGIAYKEGQITGVLDADNPEVHSNLVEAL